MAELSRIDPRSAALLVMDYQVDALTKFMTAEQSADAIACVPDLIAMARDTGMMVIHVVVAFRPGHPEVNPRPPFNVLKANGMLGAGRECEECRTISRALQNSMMESRPLRCLSYNHSGP